MTIVRAKGMIPVAPDAGASEEELLDLARMGAEQLAETKRGGVVVAGPWLDDVTRPIIDVDIVADAAAWAAEGGPPQTLYHFSADIEVPD